MEKLERWDPESRAWLHVTSPAARDYLSRAIENGDRAFQVDAAEIAELP